MRIATIDLTRLIRITAVKGGKSGLSRTEMRLGIWTKKWYTHRTAKFAI